MAASGGSKASFKDLEGGGGTFAVQYNPKEFKIDKAVNWQESKEQGPDKPKLEFQKNVPMALSMELYFDTTSDGNGDVRTKWVTGLLALTNPEVDVKAQAEESEGAMEKKRPPKVLFSWGDFQMIGVVESINVTYLMFASDGKPIRARAQVKMKEWEDGKFAGASGGGYIQGTMVSLVGSSGGPITAVACANNVSPRQLLRDNDVADPTDVPPGTQLVINRGGSSSNVQSNRSSSSGGPPLEVRDRANGN